MTEFADALTLHDGEFPGSYRVDVSAAWTIGGGINGGLLLATVAKGLGHALGARGHTEPLAVTAYYLSPTRPGEAMIETDIARQGGSSSTGSAALVQYADDGRREERMRVLGSFTDLGSFPTDDAVTRLTPPDLPPLEECLSVKDAPQGSPVPAAELLERSELRFDPATVGWAMGEPSGRGLIQAYFRLIDGHEPDPFVLLFACDVLPPATFDLGRSGWAPTIELSAQVLGRPAPGWLRIKHVIEHSAAGHFIEDCQVWDSTDRLVAQSRQLARFPRP